MKIQYNNYLRRTVPALFSLLAFASCSDWTDTESLNIHYPTIEEENPGLYEEYLASLRAYKQSEHKVFIAKFDNKQAEPVGQGENIAALPDSVDFIVLTNPDNLNSAVAQEMQDVRRKGTKTLYTIDYTIIEAEYNKMLEEEEADKPESPVEETREGGEEPDTDRFLDFCAQRMNYYISLFTKYGYDGINVACAGKFAEGLPENEKQQVEARQQVFFDKICAWKQANPAALFFFEGKPQNLLYDKTFLTNVNYVIIPALDAETKEELLFAADMALVDGVPSDRIVFGVALPSLTDDKDTSGYFTALDNGSPMYAVKGTALLVISSEGNFVKAGVCTSRTQNDYYFGAQSNYKNVKEAISVMNPSPLN